MSRARHHDPCEYHCRISDTDGHTRFTRNADENADETDGKLILKYITHVSDDSQEENMHLFERCSLPTMMHVQQGSTLNSLVSPLLYLLCIIGYSKTGHIMSPPLANLVFLNVTHTRAVRYNTLKPSV